MSSDASSGERHNPPDPTIETGALRFVLSRADGSWKIVHKPAARVWTSGRSGFCRLVASHTKSGRPRTLIVNTFTGIRRTNRSLTLHGAPLPDLTVIFKVEFTDADTIRLSVKPISRSWHIQSLHLMDGALAISGDAYAVVPWGMGYAIPTSARVNFATRGTYVSRVTQDGVYNMRFLGLVQGASILGRGASALITTWSSPDVKVALRKRRIGGRNTLCPAITLAGDARDLEMHFIKDGGFVEIAKYYRQVIKREGLFVPLAGKIRKCPATRQHVGAPSLLFCLKAALAKNADPSVQRWYASFGMRVEPGKSIVLYTFDDLARVARHLRDEVKIGRVYFNIFAWMHGGHDMYYPDFLPADRDCGGNEGLAALCGVLRRLGHPFSLYINPILQFQGAPSANPGDGIMQADGKRYCFSAFAGGPSYLFCPSQILKYVKKYLPQLKRLFRPTASYVDYLMAVDLPECHDLSHPHTRTQAIGSYRRILEYFRSVVRGPVAAESPYEFAVPFVDRYYEWLAFNEPGGRIRIPLTELVYRECGIFSTWVGHTVNTHQGPPLLGNERVVDFIGVGRPCHLSVSSGLYYAGPETGGHTTPYARADHGWAENLCAADRLLKNSYEVTSPLSELTYSVEMTGYEFLTPDYSVRQTTFADGTVVVINRGKKEHQHNGHVLPKDGFTVSSPTFEAFYALKYRGVDYGNRGALFTIRSLDGRNLSSSKRIRIYHGFGPADIAVRNAHSFARTAGQVLKKQGAGFVFRVGREAEITFSE